MKLQKLFILPIFGLLLVGCGNTNPSSSYSSSSEIISSQVETSSEIVTSDNKTTTKVEEVKNWSQQELSLMEQYLKGQHVPYVTMDGASWAFNEEIGTISYRRNNGRNEDCQRFYNELMKIDNTIDVYGDDGEPGFYREVEYVCEETVSLRMIIYSYNYQFVCDVYLYDYVKTWPQTSIKEQIKALTGQEIDLVAPNFQASKYYAESFISDTGEYIEILIFSEEKNIQTYVDQLESENYMLEIDDYGAYYVDPSETISLSIDYLDSLNCLYLAVEQYFTFE